MEPEDFLEPEIAITAGVVAAICSPRVRQFLRKGLVYGAAGVLVASDAITSFAKNVGEGAKHASASMMQSTQEGMREARAKASGTEAQAEAEKQEPAQEKEQVAAQGEGQMHESY
jgi:hypothetical protein